MRKHAKHAVALAREHVRAGQLSKALSVLEAAHAREPLDAGVLVALARVAGRLAMHEAALRCTSAALALAPDDIEALAEHTIALRALGRHQEAIDLLASHVARDPRPELWLALANTAHEMGRPAEAEAFLEECLRLKPESGEARANLADLLFDRGDAARAHTLYDEALVRAPDNAQMHLNRAIILLHLGELKAGWRDYEYRLEIPARRIERTFPGRAPKRWDGRGRGGKPLLIAAEQGLGDQILFASLVPDLIRANDGPILMDCEPRLQPLFARSFPEITVHPCRAKSQEGHTAIDYAWTKDSGGAELVIELGSLPRLMRAGLAAFGAQRAFLTPGAEETRAWRTWLDAIGSGRKIGICWRSGKRGGLRDLQYAPLEAWSRFLCELPAHIVVAQYDVTDEELEFLSAACDRPLHVPPGLDQRHEIDRLAALLAALDAVVSAPTVVASLAAAAGTPTLKLTHSGSWTALGQEREPFLPQARIIRPRQPGDWPEAFRLALSALGETSSVRG